MVRPRLNSSVPSSDKNEPDWKCLSKADAIRKASKLLNGERSAIQVIRYLEKRSVQVTSPQAVKVLGKMHKRTTDQAHDHDDLAVSVRAILAVQKYASDHGGVEALDKTLHEVECVLAFANTVGGMEVMRAIVQELR